MNQEEANIEAKKIFDTWQKKKKEIEKDAKEKGRWNKRGLDSNNHLFKNIDEEAKQQLKQLNSRINIH